MCLPTFKDTLFALKLSDKDLRSPFFVLFFIDKYTVVSSANSVTFDRVKQFRKIRIESVFFLAKTMVSHATQG